MSGSVMHSVRGLGIPETEWSLLQPALDRIDAAFATGQQLASEALADGSLAQERYDELFDEADNITADGTWAGYDENLWAWPEVTGDPIRARADAARHLRDDASLIDFADAQADLAEGSLEKFREELAGGGRSHTSRMALATGAAAVASILIVGALAAFVYRGTS